MELLIPLQFGKVLDSVLNQDFESVTHCIIIITFLFIAVSVFGYIKSSINISISNELSRDFKNEIVLKTLNFSAEKIDELKNGELFSRFEDVDKIMSFILSVFNQFILDGCIIAVLAGVLLNISIPLALFHFFTIPILTVISFKYSKIVKKSEKDLIQKRDKHYNFLFGLIQGMKEIKSLGMVKNAKCIFESNHESVVKTTIVQSKISSLWGGGYSLLSGFFQIIVLLVSCWQIALGNLTVGMYYSFNSYASRFSTLVQTFIGFQAQFTIIMVSVDKIMSFVQEDLELPKHINRARISMYDSIHSIQVSSLKFKYKGMNDTVFDGIDMQFKSSTFYVIVGHNGSGKSTLLNLLMDYYSPNGGKIVVNDIDLSENIIENLSRKIVYIRQSPFFFNMSIIENFQLIDEHLKLENVQRVCKMVGIHDYIMSLPEQYDTELGEAGEHFSGGQIQCLAIARGMVLDADVYLLDEVTSDLDGENELNIMALLRSLNKIVILVTHRLSEIIPSDNIIVLEDGKIVATGRHDKLKNSCFVYQRLLGLPQIKAAAYEGEGEVYE